MAVSRIILEIKQDVDSRFDRIPEPDRWRDSQTSCDGIVRSHTVTRNSAVAERLRDASCH